MRFVFFGISLLLVMSAPAQTNSAASTPQQVLTRADESPLFPGKFDSLLSFISRNLRYPKAEKEKGTCFLLRRVSKGSRYLFGYLFLLFLSVFSYFASFGRRTPLTDFISWVSWGRLPNQKKPMAARWVLELI